MSHEAFILLGDALWLDFVNTARGRTAFAPDLLCRPSAYAEWCDLQHLDGHGEVAPFPTVLALRDRLSELARALHDVRQPSAGAIAALNEQLARSPGAHQLTRVGGEWRLRFAPARPLGALEAIARSAAATMAEPGLAVRQCAGEGCSLYFTDDSPTGSRRWCDAAVCGGNVWVERRRGLRR
jgi:predicted RNA-binding Zn ribbon-like protein